MTNRTIKGLGMVLFIATYSCNRPNSNADIKYGGDIFIANCASCHGVRDGYKTAPTLWTLHTYDSLTLIRKLNEIKSDSLHHGRFPEDSNKVLSSIYMYIKDYFEPRY